MSSFEATRPAVLVTPLAPIASSTGTPSHHVGSPTTSFQNPWPSFVKNSGWDILQIRFSKDRNLVPVPPRDELVPIRKPDWGRGRQELKATWIGHATFHVETSSEGVGARGVRILFDPVWSERTSPVKWFGPKRYTPTPCSLQETPDVDIVAISHNHYDHLDVDTIRELYQLRKGRIHFFCALGNVPWFLSMGISRDEVTELDWWQGVRVDVAGAGSIHLTCTPTQHNSGRSPWDMFSTLWCSWVVEEVPWDKTMVEQPSTEGDILRPGAQDASLSNTAPTRSRKLFFAGDTGYRTVPARDPTSSDPKPDSSYPHCPAFSQIGDHFGPFDLALLPIGLYSPRHFMSPVHCSPEDSICIHKDIKSKKSIGMHWGTVRGGLSAHYEDVREPPRRWREAAEKEGLVWGEQAGLMDIGETLIVE